MAATISATPNETIFRMTFRDVFGEEVIKTTVLGGAIDDEGIENIFNNLDALSNAAIVNAKVSNSRTVTGSKANPLNASAPFVNKSFIIPAYVASVQNTETNEIIADLTPTGSTAPEQLGNLINVLADNLQYQGANGTYYPGDWLWDVAASGFGTVPNVIDGQ